MPELTQAACEPREIGHATLTNLLLKFRAGRLGLPEGDVSTAGAHAYDICDVEIGLLAAACYAVLLILYEIVKIKI